MIFRIQNIESGVFFVLPRGAALTVDFNSTLFNNQSQLVGSYSYPGIMPLEPNRVNINNLHYINTDPAGRYLNAMMWLGSVPFKQVKMYFTIDNEVIHYNLYIDTAIIANLLKSLKMNGMGGDYLGGSGINDQVTFASAALFKAHKIATATAAQGTYPYVFFPWKNDGAYIDAAYVTTPAYKSTIAYGMGIVFVWTDNRIYKVIIATTAGMTPISNADHFQDITVYPDVKLPASTIINRWQLDNMGAGSFAVDDSFPIQQTHTPAFYLVYLITRIAAYFKCTLQSEWAKSADARSIVFWTNIPMSYSFIIADYVQYMPDQLLTDFIKMCRTDFGLLIDPDWTRKVFVVETIGFIQESTATDLQNLQTINYRETGTQSQAYTIEQLPDNNDKAFTDFERANPVPLVIGDPRTAIQVTDYQLQSAATKMVTEQSPPDLTIILPALPIVTNWRIPAVKMPISGVTPMNQVSTLATTAQYGFKPRFLIYHGMVADDGGYLYPYASNDNIDVLNNPVGTMSLSLTADGSAFLNIREYFNYVGNSKPFEMVFEMTPAQFMSIQNSRRVIVRDKNNSAVVAIIDQNSADFINGKDMVTAKLTLYPRILISNRQEVNPVTVPVIVPPVDNGVVYARMSLSNPQSHDHTVPPPEYLYDDADFIVRFYADAGGTIPKVVTGLPIRIQQANYYEIDGHTFDTYFNLVANGSVYNALHAYLTFSGEGGSGNSNTYSYTLMPSSHYTVI